MTDTDDTKHVHVELPHDLSCLEIAARALVNNLSHSDAQFHLNRIGDEHGLAYWIEQVQARGEI